MFRRRLFPSVSVCRLSVCLDVPACSALSLATSLLDSFTSFSHSFGKKVMVCAIFFSTFPAFLLYWPSSLNPFVLSRTNIAESISSSKSEGLNVTFGSVSETFLIPSTTLLFTVFDFRPHKFSNGDFPSAFWSVHNAYNISDKPDFSRFKTIFLFVLRRSLTVRINLSILPFPR